MDSISATSMAFGVILLAFSWVQLLFVSFKKDFAWGLSSLFVPPLSYLYAMFDFEENSSTLYLALGGWVLVLIAIL